MGAITESDLLVRSRRGDRQAFTLLVEDHTAAVYAFLHRRTGGDDQAADLTQECAFRTWLYRIALRLVASDLQRRSRRPQSGPTWRPLWRPCRRRAGS